MYGGGGLVAQSPPAVVLATPWTVALQVALSMGFPGKSTGVGCHFLLQGIFLTQGSNSGLLHCRQTLCHIIFCRNDFKYISSKRRVEKALLFFFQNEVILVQFDIAHATTRLKINSLHLDVEDSHFIKIVFWASTLLLL